MSNCQFLINQNDITFIFPPQFGLLTAAVKDFTESYNLAENCVGCTNKTISIRQWTNITLNVDDNPLCDLQVSTSDFYYVLLSLFIVSLLVPIGFGLVKQENSYKSFLIHFIVYFQLSLFMVFSDNLLIQSNFNILFYYLMPFSDKLVFNYTGMDIILKLPLQRYLYGIVYSIMILYACLCVVTVGLTVLMKLFPITHQGKSWRQYLKMSSTMSFLTIVPLYLITLLPMSGTAVLLTTMSGNEAILVFIFLYLFLPLLFLIYIGNKFNTYQLEATRINSNFTSLLFYGITCYANKPFILLCFIQLIEGFFMSTRDDIRYIILVLIELSFLLLVFISCKSKQNTSTNSSTTDLETKRSSLTIEEARQLMNMDQVCDGFAPMVFSLSKLILFILLLVNAFLTQDVKIKTIYGFIIVGYFIISVIGLLIIMLKHSIPENKSLDQDSPPDSPIDKRQSIRRLDWLKDEFDDPSHPSKSLEREEYKKKHLKFNK